MKKQILFLTLCIALLLSGLSENAGGSARSTGRGNAV